MVDEALRDMSARFDEFYPADGTARPNPSRNMLRLSASVMA
jgi:hypothetical protein